MLLSLETLGPRGQGHDNHLRAPGLGYEWGSICPAQDRSPQWVSTHSGAPPCGGGGLCTRLVWGPSELTAWSLGLRRPHPQLRWDEELRQSGAPFPS